MGYLEKTSFHPYCDVCKDPYWSKEHPVSFDSVSEFRTIMLNDCHMWRLLESGLVCYHCATPDDEMEHWTFHEDKDREAPPYTSAAAYARAWGRCRSRYAEEGREPMNPPMGWICWEPAVSASKWTTISLSTKDDAEVTSHGE